MPMMNQFSKPMDVSSFIKNMSTRKAYKRHGALDAYGRGDVSSDQLRQEILARSGISEGQLTPELEAQLGQLLAMPEQGRSGHFGSMLEGFQKTAPIAVAQQTRLAPYSAAGTDALAQQRALLGLDGVEAMNAAYNLNPAQQFAQEQSEKAMLRNRATTGGLGDEGVQESLARLTSGLTNQNIQSQLGQLGAMSARGQNLALTEADIAGGQIADMYGIHEANQQERSRRNAADSQRKRSMISNAINLGAGMYTGGASLIPSAGSQMQQLTPPPSSGQGYQPPQIGYNSTLANPYGY